MKKLLAIALAFVMLFALTVTVSAEEVIWSEDTMFFSAASWSDYETELSTKDFVAALATPGAYLVITRSVPTDVVAGTDGVYEKFLILDSWWSGKLENGTEEKSAWIPMGTGAHTIAGSPEYDVLLDCVLDDGVKVWYDAAEVLALWTEGGCNTDGANLIVISNTSSTGYDIVNVSIVVPDEPIVAPEEEAPAAEEEAPATEEEAPATEVEEAPADEETEPADTGLALAVVPMLVAAAAVVISKRR